MTDERVPPDAATERDAWRDQAVAGWVAAALPPGRTRARRAASRVRRELSLRLILPLRVERARRRARRRA